MTNDVKEFIERNIILIEEHLYEDIYDEAYENLTDQQTEELTKALSTALNEDFEKYAKKNIIKHFEYSLIDFLHDKSRGEVYLSSFVRMGMNHINGLDWDEFQLLVEQHLDGDSRVIVDNDGINLFIAKRGK